MDFTGLILLDTDLWVCRDSGELNTGLWVRGGFMVLWRFTGFMGTMASRGFRGMIGFFFKAFRD